MVVKVLRWLVRLSYPKVVTYLSLGTGGLALYMSDRSTDQAPLDVEDLLLITSVVSSLSLITVFGLVGMNRARNWPSRVFSGVLGLASLGVLWFMMLALSILTIDENLQPSSTNRT